MRLWILSVAAVFGASAAAMAATTSTGTVPVVAYIAVQPIDVCSDAGTLCAPFNTSSAFGNPAAGGPIGFFDPSTKQDLTRAMLNQFGVDLAYTPMQRLNSTEFQTLNVVQATATNTAPCSFTSGTASGLISCDFLTLSQQPAISMGGYTPTAPLSSNPTIVNLFFVAKLNPPASQAGGQLYGFSWINNNGVAIARNTFFPPFPLTPDPAIIAHELGHDLALTHTADGAGPADNLMTIGSNRTAPTVANALTNLGNGTADQLTLISQEGTTLPTSQQRVVFFGGPSPSDTPSGFLHPIGASTTTAFPPETGDIVSSGIVALASVSSVNAAAQTDDTIFFEVSGPAGQPSETLVQFILTLDHGSGQFDPQNPVVFSGPGANFVTGVDYIHGNKGNGPGLGCPQPSSECLVINLSGLPADQFLDFTQGIRSPPGPIDITKLASAKCTWKFSDGYTTTGDFSLDQFGGLVPCNSQFPDPAISPTIDPSLVPVNAFACTPTTGACPNPEQTGVEDGDPSEERQPGGGGGG